MDIKEAQVEKEKAELLILDIINDLVEKTGANFTDVKINTQKLALHNRAIITSLRIELSI